MLKINTIMLGFFLFFCACQQPAEKEKMTPEMAKNMLKLKGYNFDESNYLDAVRKNDVSAILAFYDAEINPDALSDSKIPALNFAIQNSEPKTVKIMLNKCNLNLKDNNGNTPLYLTIKSKKQELTDALLEKGADVNSTGRDGKTLNQSCLYLAVIRKDQELLKKLLDKGANPNLLDSGGASPLSEICAVSGNIEIAKMLLDKGADVNILEPQDGTALHYAASNANLTAEKRAELVKLLLAKGADKNIKDKKGRTVLARAKENNFTEVIELLK
jgi:ankyrin repeat protein